MTVSTENAAPPKSTKSRNSNSSVQTQIKSTSQFEFVPRDTEESEFLDVVNFWGAAFSVETHTLCLARLIQFIELYPRSEKPYILPKEPYILS